MVSHPILEISNLEISYGGIRAVKDIHLYIQEGELVSLIGSNGAGKTSTLKAIAGLLKPSMGSIQFQGKPSTYQSHHLVQEGLALVPEGRGIFTRMTVIENLMMGAYLRNDEQIEQDLQQMFAYFPRILERAYQLAGTLSGGEQQMLAIARALMSRPKLLLLDEPTMGLSPIMVDNIFEVIRKISQQGMTIFLVEQNANIALAMSDRAYVMESGEITMTGTGEDLIQDPRIHAAYLGA
jgi:branched-chain amino acid transport system ATP-binding protein